MEYPTLKLPKFSFRKRTEKETDKEAKRGAGLLERFRKTKEELLMDNDLLFTLTYMASLSTAQLSRDKIFEMAAEKEEYAPSKYFKKIRDLTQKWYYDYATACNLIAEKVEHERLRKLFNRFSDAISAGEPDREFLDREWKVFKTIRKDEYERALESLRKWTDAYTSILVSASLISVVILLSVIIYQSGDPATTLYGAALSNFVIYAFGVGMLFKAVPKDRKVHDFHIKSREQTLISKLSPILIPAAFAALVFLAIIPAANPDFKYGSIDMKGAGFILAGAIMLPIAILGRMDDKRISKRDEAFTTFIRSLGVIKSGAGVSVAEALSRIDQKNLGELKDLVLQLYRRLSMDLDPRLCWEKFVGESGSYLIQKLTSIFIDATDLGGDADTVGEVVSSSNLEMVLLRLKRDLISSGFVSLIIPLHMAMVGLLLFITQILTIFTQYISMLYATQLSGIGSMSNVVDKLPGGLQGLNIGIFGSVPTELLSQYTLFIILSLTLANTIAANVVKGGGKYMYIYYACILFIISGVLMVVVPQVVEWAFSLPSLVEMEG